VRRILRYGASWGIRDFVLNLHYLPETITAQVGDGADLGVRVRYSFESPVLGSAGGPRKALDLLPDEPFFIINGGHAHQRRPGRACRAPPETRVRS
jgi:NDP-sugar pyrophosphorylase family protein